VALQGFDLIWYGDSITYELVAGPYQTREWASYFGQYRSAVLGVPGDVMSELLWRLINGEAPKAR
jgi:hypothetical protein